MAKEKKTATTKEEEFEMLEDGTMQWTTPSGKVAIAKSGKAKHATEANRLIDGDQSSYMVAILSILVTFDGNKIPFEEIGEFLSLADYNDSVVKLSDANFM